MSTSGMQDEGVKWNIILDEPPVTITIVLYGTCEYDYREVTLPIDCAVLMANKILEAAAEGQRRSS